MPDSKTYTGGCHCGQVRFECTTDLAMVTACNCSICTKKGLHFTFIDPKSFQLRAGEENLKEYLFNKHAIHHQLCVDCGVDVFARGKKPDGVGRGRAERELHRRHRTVEAEDDAGGWAEHVRTTLLVMPGLDPGIHDLLAGVKDVDGRVKPGHDGKRVGSCAVTHPTPCTAGKSPPR